MKKACSRLISVTLAALSTVAMGVSPEELVKKQCRSVHLGFRIGESTALYNEIVVSKSAPGTYFCALGFDRGYFGMQELANGKKLIIFSVWDRSQTNDKHSVEESQRARVMQQGEGVRVGRFGGEGTGAQSFYDYDWKDGERMRFLVKAEAGEGFTEFGGWFFDNQRKEWQLMTRFRTPTSGIHLKGAYSFIEDFRRNHESAKIQRAANFENGWALGKEGEWSRMNHARFTADVTPSTNIDAGPVGDGFFLKTGGETRMETTQLRSMMENTTVDSKIPLTAKQLMEK